MTWATISGAGTTTATKFFGDVMNKINDMFNGVDISDTVTINTAVTWTFQDNSFKLRDSDDSNTYSIRTGNLAGDFDLSIPVIAANDSFSLLGINQTFTGINQFDKERIDKVVAVPGDPATGFTKTYSKQIDANNDTRATKALIGGNIVEVLEF